MADLMNVTLLAVILLALGAGFGVLLVIAGIRGSDAPPALQPTPRLAKLARALAGPMLGLRVAAGLLAGVGVELATRWPVAAAAVPALIICWPAMFGAAGATRNRIAQLEALALWTESLKDLVAGATGLHEAIPASVGTASPLLQRPLGRLTGLLEAREPLAGALEQLAADLADPTADLVIAALIMNAKARGPGLASSLERLAESTREELELRRRIDASRRGGRRNLRIIITMVVIMAGLMAFVFPPAFSRPYRTPVGQVVLLLVFGIFAACFAWIRRLSDPDVPETFLTDPAVSR
jgi:Flp pilus assembly protein TadB